MGYTATITLMLGNRCLPFLLLPASLCPAQTVTYSEHIAPLLYDHCVKCHRPNQVAPFSLLTYDDAVHRGRDMVIQTQSHYMPPWKPEPGWAAYRDERRLTPAQIALIKSWVDGGMPRGRSRQGARASEYSPMAGNSARPI